MFDQLKFDVVFYALTLSLIEMLVPFCNKEVNPIFTYFYIQCNSHHMLSIKIELMYLVLIDRGKWKEWIVLIPLSMILGVL